VFGPQAARCSREAVLEPDEILAGPRRRHRPRTSSGSRRT
jgi:hypothetical protein